MIKDGIEVWIRRVSKGTRYLEYEHEKPKYNSNTCIAYIRATTGEQFEVHIKLHQVFRYYTCSGLQIRLCIDANEAPDVYWYEKKHVPVDGVEYCLTDFQVEVAGEWQSGKLAFGEIGNGETAATVQFAGGSVFGNKTDPVPLNNFVENLTPYDGPEFVAARRRRLGTIRVSVQRGNIGGKTAPRRVSAITSSAVEADKSSGITHQVTTLHRRRISTPEEDTSTNFKPVLGVHGERYNFEFRYRSLPELLRLGLCDENGRIVEPEPKPEPQPELKPALEDDDYSDNDDDEEDGLPIPPNHRRISKTKSQPPPVSSGQRTSSRLRAMAETANRAALPPPKVPSQKPANKRNESTFIKQEKMDDGAEKPIPSADVPVRSIEAPFPGTETHISRLTAVPRLQGITPSSNLMRPVKRRQDLATMSPAPAKKPRLGGEEKPAAAARPLAPSQQAMGPPSVSAARPVPAGTDKKLVRHGTNIGTFMASKPKQEPGSVSRPALSAAGPSVSTGRSVPGDQGVSTRQGVPGPKPARTTTNAPSAHPAQSDFKSLESVDLEMKAIDIRNQLNELEKKRSMLDHESARLRLVLERIKVQQERQRILDSRSAAGPGHQQQQQRR